MKNDILVSMYQKDTLVFPFSKEKNNFSSRNVKQKANSTPPDKYLKSFLVLTINKVQG